MKKEILVIIMMFLLSFIFVGCDNDNQKIDAENKETNSEYEKVEWKFSRKVARLVQEDGWVYTFEYEYPKSSAAYDEGLIPFSFYGVNLRYRYNDLYKKTYTYVENGEEVTVTVPCSMQMLGDADTDAAKRDAEKIAGIIHKKGVTSEELLAINPDDVEFEGFDKNIFFDLMHEALTGEPHVEGNIELPVYALLTEPLYIDDYKFQIGFVSQMGTIDVIFIDVLYKTGDEYDAYIQLSDLVESNEATAEQIEVYELIQEISDGIISNNDLLYQKDKNDDKIIGGIDFSRLYVFLKDIRAYEITKYLVYS